MAGRPRKQRLSRDARDVLWLLAEAGEESVGTIVNTLRASRPEADPVHLFGALGSALSELVRLGLIDLCFEAGSRLEPVPADSVPGLLRLADNMVWNDESDCYAWDGSAWNGRRLVVLLSEDGLGFLER